MVKKKENHMEILQNIIGYTFVAALAVCGILALMGGFLTYKSNAPKNP
jgi:hypothetical protein